MCFSRLHVVDVAYDSIFCGTLKKPISIFSPSLLLLFAMGESKGVANFSDSINSTDSSLLQSLSLFSPLVIETFTEEGEISRF